MTISSLNRSGSAKGLNREVSLEIRVDLVSASEMKDVSTLPMFPLGMVLLPAMMVPIHVFEPRYRQMTKECLDGDREFGIVLIERGSEVGGGDVRTNAGTVARIIEAQEFPDGRWGLVASGTRRIQVCRWLEDDPYPRAEVQDWPDGELRHHEGGGISARLPPVVSAWRRVLALQSELGAPGLPAEFELSEDASTAVWQLAALSPLGPMDRQQLLTVDNSAQRLDLLAQLLTEAEELIRARIEMG